MDEAIGPSETDVFLALVLARIAATLVAPRPIFRRRRRIGHRQRSIRNGLSGLEGQDERVEGAEVAHETLVGRQGADLSVRWRVLVNFTAFQVQVERQTITATAPAIDRRQKVDDN